MRGPGAFMVSKSRSIWQEPSRRKPWLFAEHGL